MEPAPVKEQIVDKAGFAPRLWIRWFQYVQKALGATVVETIRITDSDSPYVISDGGVNLVCNTTNGPILATFPIGVQGVVVRVVNVGASSHAVTMDGNGANISGAPTKILSDGQISETRFDSVEGWN